MGYSTKKNANIEISNGKDKIVINGNILEQASKVVRAINHPLRKKLVDFLNENGETVVSKIYRKLDTEQSVASQHLAILRNAGFVNARKDGRFIHYSVNPSRFKNTAKILEDLV